MRGTFQKEGKQDEAERALSKAIELANDNPQVQGWAGRFFLQVRRDPVKALDHYLSAYFFDPHFYDGEFAEYRIKKLAGEIAQRSLARRKEAGGRLEDLLSDQDPVLVDVALRELRSSWKPQYRERFLELLSHDDESIRWQAAEALMEHADASFEPILEKLLEDRDHRRRGLAAYMAVRLRGEKAFPLVKEWLREDSQLLRFDAYSALVQFGGDAGRKLAQELGREEKHPFLKEMIAKLGKEE